MSSDWVTRVDQATTGTVHEQLRMVLGEAREVLDRFQTASWEQGGLLLDAQREFEAGLNDKIAKISADVEAAMASFRETMDAVARLEKSFATAFARVSEEQHAPGLAVAG
ncbi:MAG TPA: hypothetical protein VJ922_05570 [Actinomycetota bacterium]|nr:hypothetical protein [Actinomycetota bacterium]